MYFVIKKNDRKTIIKNKIHSIYSVNGFWTDGKLEDIYIIEGVGVKMNLIFDSIFILLNPENFFKLEHNHDQFAHPISSAGTHISIILSKLCTKSNQLYLRLISNHLNFMEHFNKLSNIRTVFNY